MMQFKYSQLGSTNNMNTSSLFTLPSTAPPLFLSHSLSARSRAPREEWSIRELQAKMRRGVRKEVEVASMREELQVFYGMQKEIVITKIAVILCLSLGLFFLLGIQGTVIFNFLLLLALQLFCTLVLPFWDQNIIANVRKMQPILYCSIFYNLLKWTAGVNNREIDWIYTSIAIVSTVARSALAFYQPFLLLASREILGKALKRQNIIAKFALFPQYLIERARMVGGFAKYLTLITCASFSLLSLLLLYFDKFSMDVFLPRNILTSFLIFLSLQLYLDFIDFINLSFTQNQKLGRVIKDKIPIFLNLLRLQAKPFNRQIQLQSLKCVFLKVSNPETRKFLQTETCKSLIYHTYMDIFNQYATLQLEKTQSVLLQFLRTAKVNDRTISQKKGLLEDLLIYFRKTGAFLSSEWQFSRVLNELATINFMLATIQAIQGEEDREVRLSPRVVSLTAALLQRVRECSQRTSLSSYSRLQLLGLRATLECQLQPN